MIPLYRSHYIPMKIPGNPHRWFVKFSVFQDPDHQNKDPPLHQQRNTIGCLGHLQHLRWGLIRFDQIWPDISGGSGGWQDVRLWLRSSLLLLPLVDHDASCIRLLHWAFSSAGPSTNTFGRQLTIRAATCLFCFFLQEMIRWSCLVHCIVYLGHDKDALRFVEARRWHGHESQCWTHLQVKDMQIDANTISTFVLIS